MYELLEELITQNLHLRGGEEPNLIELDETSYQLLMVDLKSNICPLGNSHSPNIKIDTVSFRSGITCKIVNTGRIDGMSISIKREEENKNDGDMYSGKSGIEGLPIYSGDIHIHDMVQGCITEEKRIGPMSNWSEDDGKGFDSKPIGGFSDE